LSYTGKKNRADGITPHIPVLRQAGRPAEINGQTHPVNGRINDRKTHFPIC